MSTPEQLANAAARELAATGLTLNCSARMERKLAALLLPHFQELAKDRERYMQRIYSHDEGPCDHACHVCVKNAGADDSMVIPDHLCTYHEVCAAISTPNQIEP